MGFPAGINTLVRFGAPTLQKPRSFRMKTQQPFIAARTAWRRGRSRTGLMVACAGLLAGMGSSAIGQETDGGERAGRMAEAEKVLPRVDREDRVVMPTRSRVAEPVRPGLTGGEDWADAVGLRAAGLPEGSFLIERPGRLVSGPGGRVIFVPTGEDRVAGERPMLVLPNAALERLEVAVTGRGDEPGVRLSGEVFVYNGRSHLLMSSAFLGEAVTEPEPVAGQASGDAGAAEPDAEPASLRDDPDVKGLLEELEAERPSDDARVEPVRPARDAGVTTAGTAPVPDGTPIVRRRGRMVRTGEGAWAFVFDNDLDDALAAASMVVLPCRLLERIERRAMIDGDAYQLVVSGRVHTYEGQAYLLPTMVLSVPANGLVPMQ